MRVAIFAVSLLGVAGVQLSQAQIVSAEGATFHGAVPATGRNNPSFIVPELSMPAVRQAALVRGANARGAGVGGSSVASSVVRVPAAHLAATHFTTVRSVMGAPKVRAGSSIAMPTRALQVRQAPVRSVTDHVLAGVVALMLIAYQLRRKHRVLHPHPFTI